MTIRVSLHHKTSYRYDRPVTLYPQVARLRPAPHCRTPILSYAQKVLPADHFVNWQQDPHGNFLSRYVFPKPVRHFSLEVDLVADMTVINPFDFFVDEAADIFPFAYEQWLATELKPFLESGPPCKQLEKYAKHLRSKVKCQDVKTTDFVVAVNRQLESDIEYQVRLEPGVQTPEETLTRRVGSCRDTSWLLVNILRGFGLAARFVSGYLIQLAPDQKPLEGPAGPESDFTDLHAWAEVFLPGAGWVGLDPTSGLLAGEGHIPLAATPDPKSAAPISGGVEHCEVEFDFAMEVTRIHEDPRVTKPYTESQWRTIDALGHAVDKRLQASDVRLTMGGEPTFVSIDDMEGAEWNTAAVGENKRRLSEELLLKLRDRFGRGGLLHYGQGKWYPGEPLPRWSLACYWRIDGQPMWKDASLIADTGSTGDYGNEHAKALLEGIAERLRVRKRYVQPCYENVMHFLMKENELPVNVDPSDPKLDDPEERARMIRVFERGLSQPSGFLLPIRRQWWQAKDGRSRWMSGAWPVRASNIQLLPGDSPVGLRLPLDTLPLASGGEAYPMIPIDPLAPRDALPSRLSEAGVEGRGPDGQRFSEQELEEGPSKKVDADDEDDDQSPEFVVRTAMCVEVRNGHIHVFMPPVERIEDYLELVEVIEDVASSQEVQVIIEGYHPPSDPRVDVLKVTPDPGVIEVNTQPSSSWEELVALTRGLYDDARQTRLGTEKFDLDGKHTGTGGGNHVVVGGRSATESPFLRRPDVLKSLIAFWVNHPSMSYLFSGRFIGPTSQAPRVDEGRRDSLYELKLAFDLVPQRGQDCPPWLVDRIFRHLLTDLTGNTHRAEICIDKLYSPDSSTGRLGLVEFRGFEMPPHPEMSLTQQLLIRGLIAAFWDEPYRVPVADWGTTLHDKFMLPHYIWKDFGLVIQDLRQRGIDVKQDWFAPHFEFRFPQIGTTMLDDISIELRTAIEPWYVLGEEPAGGATARFVDSSVERLQVLVDGFRDHRYVLTCNGRRLPLAATGVQGQFACGVRYRAWQPASCLHPTIPVHSPLSFDMVDVASGTAVAGCSYHVSHPAGRNYEHFPVNGSEAEARRAARFFPSRHTPGKVEVPCRETNEMFPLTLDLRRSP